MNCGNTTTTAMSHLQFISSRYSSLERTWVSTIQARWEQGDLSFCGGVFRFYSVTVWSIWKLDLTGENQVLVNPETNHWLMSFPTFLFLFILFYYFLAPKSGGLNSPQPTLRAVPDWKFDLITTTTMPPLGCIRRHSKSTSRAFHFLLSKFHLVSPPERPQIKDEQKSTLAKSYCLMPLRGLCFL